mgnify:CR=1 FL=1
MIRYNGRVQGSDGNAIVGATIAVSDYYNGVLVDLYQEDGVTPFANPVTTDSDGLYYFKINAGRYNFTVLKDGIEANEFDVNIMAMESIFVCAF